MQITISAFTMIIRTFICAYVLMVFSSVSVTGQTDTVFWFAAPDPGPVYASGARQGDRPVAFWLIAGDQPAQVTVSQPAGGAMPAQTINIPANSYRKLDVTPWIDSIKNYPPNTVANKGIKILSDAPIQAHYYNMSGDTNINYVSSPEIFILKGQNALGTNFLISSVDNCANDNNFAYFSYYPKNSFSIVASEDNTKVTIIPSAGLEGGALAGNPINITLNKGQSYSVRALSHIATDHLAGSKVTADKPVAITVSDDQMQLTTAAGDLGGDQIIPITHFGNQYIAVNGNKYTPTTGDHVYVMATENNTVISIDGTVQTTINAGQTWRMEMKTPAVFIEAGKPVSVWQLSGIESQSGITPLPQLSACGGSRSVSYVSSIGRQLILHVVVASGGENNFTINGNATTLTGTQFAPVPGTGGQWLYTRLALSYTSYPRLTLINVKNTTTNFHMAVLDGDQSKSGSATTPNTIWGATYGYVTNFGKETITSNFLGPDTTICLGDTLLIDATLSGATDYIWSTGQTTPTIRVDKAGAYWVRISGTSCTSQDTIVIATKTPPEPFTLGNDTSICNSGHLILKPSPRPPTGTYHWQDGTTDTTLTVKAPGHYRLTIKNICGSATDSIYIDRPMEDLSPYLTTLASCHNTAGGNAWIKPPATDTNKYRYAWLNTENAILSTTDSLRNVRAGNYYLNIRSGICDTTLPLTIKETKYTASFISDTLICASQPTTLHNTSDPYYTHFTWYFGNGTTSQHPNPTYSYQPGSYEIILVANGLSCQDTAKGRIEVEQTADSFKILKNKEYACTGEEIIFSTTPHTNENPLTWNLDEGNTITTNASILQHAYDKSGKMAITIRTNQKVCPDIISKETITIYPFPKVYLGPDTGICLNGKSIILTNIFPHEKGYQYHWSTGDTTQQLQVTHPGTYSLTVTTQQGCATIETIEINKSCYTDLPNAFSPNGDGENDYFFPRQLLSRQLTAFNMKILNRWGQIIFRTTDTKGRGWDGKFNGTDQPAGVYVYIIEVKTENQHIEKYTGNVTLIR